MSKVKIFIILAFLAYISVSSLYIKSLRADLAVSEANNAVLVKAQEENINTIKELKTNYSQITELNKSYISQVQKQDEKIYELNSKLDRLGTIAKKKPKAIQKLVNKNSKKILKCFEGISKNDLTDCE